jgi:ligand-binding sensor domain-containing protein
VGLVKLNKSTGEFIVYGNWNSQLPDNHVFAIAIDGDGNKWIGTYGGGLAVYREGGVILQLPVVSAQKVFDNGGT